MKKLSIIICIMLILEIIIYLFSPLKKPYDDITNLELWYVVTLFSGFMIILKIIKKWSINQRIFTIIIFLIYILSHYINYI